MAKPEPIFFETQHRAKFREIDPYGHMNMAYYLTYLTDHRFEGMRRYLSIGHEEIADLPFAFHTAHVSIDYLRPIVADQEFKIRSHVSEWGRLSLWVDFEILDNDGEQLATSRMKIGCIDKATGRPSAWPVGVKDSFFHTRPQSELDTSRRVHS